MGYNNGTDVPSHSSCLNHCPVFTKQVLKVMEEWRNLVYSAVNSVESGMKVELCAANGIFAVYFLGIERNLYIFRESLKKNLFATNAAPPRFFGQVARRRRYNGVGAQLYMKVKKPSYS